MKTPRKRKGKSKEKLDQPIEKKKPDKNLPPPLKKK
jgi:hypothetical protein